VRITCNVKPKSTNAVIVAQGGIDSGYSLYLKDGVPNFAVRENRQLYSIAAKRASGESYNVEAELQSDGKMTLSIDHQSAATGKAPGPIQRQPHERLCVGFDDGRPVANYKFDPKEPYQGEISGLKVLTGVVGSGQ
jgi:hypothetical protein